MTDSFFELTRGRGPLVATALHAGHGMRAETVSLCNLTASERLREEDPYTDGWTRVAPTRLVALRSRFEADLNRPRDRAVYGTPADAWGLDVWRVPPSAAVVERSLAGYDRFYAAAEALFTTLLREHERLVVFDLHSYNHRRAGAAAAPADPADNPEVNVGTGTLDRDYWAPVVDALVSSFQEATESSDLRDVRENVKFTGGHFASWSHTTFPRRVCCLAIEFKKTFMDEWTGACDADAFASRQGALTAAVARVLEVLPTMTDG